MPALPPAVLRAWLWCGEPIDPAFMGSQLVVVWFAEECLDEPIVEVVLRAVRGLAWDDPELAIPWPVSWQAAMLTQRDRQWPHLQELGEWFSYAEWPD